MADFNASLPIRTENAGDVQMKLVDGADTARVLKIEEDGSINANVVTGEIDVRDLAFATDKVDVSGSEVSLAPGQSLDIGNFPSSFEISNLPATQPVSATDLDIRALAFADDKVDVSGSSVSVDNFPASFEVSNFPASFEISNLGSITDLDIRDLSHLSDSVTAHLAEGSQIEISNASLTVQATDFDMRDLSFASDKVDVSGSEISLAPGQQIELTNPSLTIQATDLDIRDLSFESDKVDVSGSSVTVSATALDIRPLSAMAGDNVAAMLTDGTNNLKIMPDQTMPVSATAFDIRALSSESDSISVSATSLDIRPLSALAGDNVAAMLTDGTNNVSVTSTGRLNVRSEKLQDEYASYYAHFSIAGGMQSEDHVGASDPMHQTYVTGMRVSASGRIKAELQLRANEEYPWYTVAVAYSSSANPNIEMDFGQAVAVSGEGQYRLVVYNRESEAMDIHSTILSAIDRE